MLFDLPVTDIILNKNRRNKYHFLKLQTCAGGTCNGLLSKIITCK